MDWIREQVHGTVREIRRRSAVIPEKEDLAAFLSDNLYEKNIHLSATLMKSKTSSQEQRIQGILDVGHWAWSGGPSVAKFAANYLPSLKEIAMEPENPVKVVKAAVQSIGNICNSSKDASASSSLIDMVESMCKLLDLYNEPEHEDLRHNIVWTLLVLGSENNTNQKKTIAYSSLKETLRRMTKDNWKGWKYNEAQRLYRFLGYDRQNERKTETPTNE